MTGLLSSIISSWQHEIIAGKSDDVEYLGELGNYYFSIRLSFYKANLNKMCLLVHPYWYLSYSQYYSFMIGLLKICFN